MSGDEEFTCRAINDYDATSTDELDLKEGGEYTITQVSENLWNSKHDSITNIQ